MCSAVAAGPKKRDMFDLDPIEGTAGAFFFSVQGEQKIKYNDSKAACLPATSCRCILPSTEKHHGRIENHVSPCEVSHMALVFSVQPACTLPPAQQPLPTPLMNPALPEPAAVSGWAWRWMPGQNPPRTAARPRRTQ